MKTYPAITPIQGVPLFVLRISSNTRCSLLYRALFISQYKVAAFCNSRSPLYWVLAVLRHIPKKVMSSNTRWKYFNSRLPMYWVLVLLQHQIPIQGGHKAQYKVTTFWNSRLSLYWYIVLECVPIMSYSTMHIDKAFIIWFMWSFSNV